jgi:predicted RNase H-like HicB family nuclease
MESWCKKMRKIYQDDYAFTAIIEKGRRNFGVSFEDLPGCIATGDTISQALTNAKEALALHLWGMEQDGDRIPKPTPIDKIKISKKEFLCLIDVNMFSIRAAMNNRPVKKTLTIPWELNAAAEKEKINFSQLLQSALRQKLGIL